MASENIYRKSDTRFVVLPPRSEPIRWNNETLPSGLAGTNDTKVVLVQPEVNAYTVVTNPWHGKINLPQDSSRNSCWNSRYTVVFGSVFLIGVAIIILWLMVSPFVGSSGGGYRTFRG